jgi:iduronate 2-sulfatase
MNDKNRTFIKPALANGSKLLAGLLLSSAPALMGCQQYTEQKPMNVLFLSIDDLRPALGCYGDPLAISPNIDALAQHGVVFSRHYVQAPSCGPSRTSMLTGLRPDEVKVVNHATHFRDTKPDVVTLPELFKNNGYTAISLGKVFHYSAGYNDSRSWDKEYFLKEEQFSYLLPENRDARGKGPAIECLDVADNAYMDGQMADKAIEYLRAFSDSKTPFFLAVGHLKPHLPFTAPKRYWDKFDRNDFYHIDHPERPVGAPEVAFHNWQELRGYGDVPDDGPLTPDQEAELRHAYYACVSYIDAQVGRVLQALDEFGLRDNTIVVFWGDHGFHLGELNLWCKSTNFELSAHAPLIIAAPGAEMSGTTSQSIVQSLDIYPTIVELAGMKSQQKMSGKSLVPLLNEKNPVWTDVAFNQFARPYNAAIGGRQPMTHMGYSVRTNDWRYTSWFDINTGVFEYPELYDQRSTDVIVNLAGSPEYAERQKELHQLVENYMLGK